MNSYQIFIDGQEYKNVSIPFKFGEFLDVQLDHAVLQLTRVNKQFFAPTTPVKIVLNSSFKDKYLRKYNQSKTLYYIIAKDNFRETPVGSGYYSHELTLIEPTKLLEGIPVETLCFTNSQGSGVQDLPFYLAVEKADTSYEGLYINSAISDEAIKLFRQYKLKYPIIAGTTLVFPTARELVEIIGENVNASSITRYQYWIFKDWNADVIDGTRYEISEGYFDELPANYDDNPKITFGKDTENTNHKICLRVVVSGIDKDDENKAFAKAFRFTFLDFKVYPTNETKKPLVPWTIESVIDRVLDLERPILYNVDYDENATLVHTPITKKRFKLGDIAGYSHSEKIVENFGLTGQLGYDAPLNGSKAFTYAKEISNYSIENKGGFYDYTITISENKKSLTIEYNIIGLPSAFTEAPYIELKVNFKEYVNLSKILAPEFTFTQQSLREVLQTIGGYIHGEPRLLFNEETQEFDTITFDMYGSQKFAEYFDTNEQKYKRLSEYNYEDLSGSYDIEQACTSLNSYMDNLVNRIKDSSGAVGQPYENGFQSLRTENSNIRYTDNGEVFFPTAYPIKQIHSFKVKVDEEIYDITPCLYDERIYNSQLSSFNESYGSSKAYALYYKQDQKGIYGFWFKNTNIASSAVGLQPFQSFAITNIIKVFSGSKKLVSSMEDIFNRLSFELIYSPIYSVRVSHSKSYIGDWLNSPRILNYSQGSNSVEMESFGENIKGAVERMGTLEKSYTFTCYNLDTIPNPGEMWDEEYYISTVSVEVGREKFKVTVGLSKNFNRISEYITVSSYKRLYEVSEIMTQERTTLYKDYVVITDFWTDGNGSYDLYNIIPDDCLMNVSNDEKANPLQGLREIFVQATDEQYNQIAVCYSQLYSYDGKELGFVALPVVSSACGNIMEFSWEYKDNYSAGQQRVEISGQKYGKEVEYSDYYGRGYYERFYLASRVADRDGTGNNPDKLPVLTSEFVSPVIKPKSNYYKFLTRKDSRETLKRVYSVEFVTDKNNFVIGSALAANCPFVSGFKDSAKLYIFKNRLNKFSKKLDLSSDNVLAVFDINPEKIKIDTITGIYCEGTSWEENTQENGLSWAYVTPLRNGKTTSYQNEKGEIETLTEQYGGELLFGCNTEINSGDIVGKFAMYPTHDIHEFLKQRNK